MKDASTELLVLVVRWLLVYYAWNYLSAVFHWPVLTLWQAFVLLALCSLLLKRPPSTEKDKL